MLARRYSGHTRRDQEGKDTMWVYQETKTEADALVPRLPEREPLPMKEAEQTSYTPEPPQKEIPRRKRFRASRDCILLAAAYLFGTLMAGILQALCDAEEMETLAYYLSCWRSAFAASSTPQAVGLFGTELAVVLGAAAVFLLLGLSAVGPLPIFLFAMLYGTGSGLLSAQLLTGLGGKQLVLFLLTASLPTGQQPYPRLFLRERREGGRHSPYRRGTASGRTVCLADCLPLPALRRSHRACVPRKSSDAGRISGWFSCGSGPNVV